MMRDWQTVGATPAEEDCEQVGTDKFDMNRAKIETRVFVSMLIRIFKPKHVQIKPHMERGHDAGDYPEAAVYFDSDDQEEIQEMLRIERDIPAKWDDEARTELAVALSRLSERYAANE